MSAVVIRSFCNADLPKLVEIWNQHWTSCGLPTSATPAQLEQAILARTTFQRDDLLVATIDEVPIAWMHCVARRVDPGNTIGSNNLIAAACALPESEPSVLNSLCTAFIDRSASDDHSQWLAGLVRDTSVGYAGLAPFGHGVGILEQDDRTSAALSSVGFSPCTRVDRWVVSTAGYRPPVNRTALQLRRTTRIETRSFLYRDRPRSIATSHLDIEQTQLVDMSGQVLAEIHIWLSDPEAEVMPPNRAILDLGDIYQRGSINDTESYLIGGIIQSLGQRGIGQVETAIDTDQQAIAERVGQLKFTTSDHGQQWTR